MTEPVLTTLITFGAGGALGQSPGYVTIAPDGMLYGITQTGGVGGYGVVYTLDLASGAVTILADFYAGANGYHPNGPVTVDAAGNVFGVESGSGDFQGDVFEIAHGSGKVTVLAPFVYAPGPAPGLVLDSHGDLFGVTTNGGTSGQGTIFEIVAGQHKVTTLATFDYANGAYPEGGLVMDAAGDLFGVTTVGGLSDGMLSSGTVFELPAGSHTVESPAVFVGANGNFPASGLVSDAAGDLFGVTQGTGGYSLGSVFEMAAGTDKLTTLANFYGANGAFADTALTVDAAGDVFGTTSGIYNDDGNLIGAELFRIDAATHTFEILMTFTADTVGEISGGLVADAAGNLYGVSTDGLVKLTGVGYVVASAGPSATRVVLQGYDNVVVGPVTAALVTGRTGSEVSGPASGNATVNGSANSETIVAYGLHNTISANGGNDLVYAGQGDATVTVSDADGNNVISGGRGSASVTLGNGNDTVVLGGSTNRVTLGDGADIIVSGDGGAGIEVGNGVDRITLAGIGNVARAGDGNDSVTGGQGQDRITLGNGRDSVIESGYGNIIAVGQGADTIVAGSGADTVVAAGGNDTITLAGYGNSVTSTGGNTKILGAESSGGNTISLGNGRNNVQLGGAGNAITLGTGTNVVVAGSGYDTVTVGAGADTITLAGYHNTADLGAGFNTVTSGSGDDVVRLTGVKASLLIGGTGDMVFLGGASATITDQASILSLDVSGGGIALFEGFDAAHGAVLDLIGSRFSSPDTVVQALADDHHGGAVLTLGSGAAIDFAGLAPGALNAVNFRVG